LLPEIAPLSAVTLGGIAAKAARLAAAGLYLAIFHHYRLLDYD